jgi:hypothetical protein
MDRQVEQAEVGADGVEGDDHKDDEDEGEEAEQPWLFGVAEQLGVQELKEYIEYGDDVRVISLDSTCWPSAFAALIALRSKGLVNFANPDGGQPPQAECVQCMLTAFRALCAKSTVLVIKTDPRRRATIAVIGLLVRCIEAAYDEVLQQADSQQSQVVVVLTGWSQETLAAAAVVAGGSEEAMQVIQVDTSGEVDDEDLDDGEDEDEEDDVDVQGGDDDGNSATSGEEDDEQGEEEGEGADEEDSGDEDEEPTWLYGTHPGVTTAELEEVMEADEGVVLLELILSDSAGVNANGDHASDCTTGALKRVAEQMHASLQKAAGINERHVAALRRCASDFGSISMALTALLEDHSLILIVRGKPSDAQTTTALLALLECLHEAQASEDASQVVVVLVGWVGDFRTISGTSLRSGKVDGQNTSEAALVEYEITDLGL